MGLYIYSNLHSINFHKRLTELERISEISTGLIALQHMIEQGEKIVNHTETIETLGRLLPHLPATQQSYVFEEIIKPLLTNSSEEIESKTEEQASDVDEVQDNYIPSDYEMEYRLTLARHGDLNTLKQPMNMQYAARKMQELKLKEERRELERDKIRAEAKANNIKRLEKNWAKVDLVGKTIYIQKKILKAMEVAHQGEVFEDHPIMIQIKARLKELS